MENWEINLVPSLFQLPHLCHINSRGCKQVCSLCCCLNEYNLKCLWATEVCNVRGWKLVPRSAEEYMKRLMIALVSLYTVYKNWSYCIIQLERREQPNCSKGNKIYHPTHKPKLLLFKHWEGEKKKCLCDRLCCLLQLYIGQIWGPSHTVVKCCCPHLVKYIAQHIVVSFNVTWSHYFVTTHLSKNVWTVDKLHRKKKNVLMKAAVSGREWKEWRAVEPKPRERQMTGETSPCQQQPTLLWPTDLSDGWSCAGTRDRRGIGGADQSGPKPYIQKHIPKNVFKKLLSGRPQRTAGVWNVAGFVLDLPTLMVVV